MGGLAGNWIVHRTPCIEELHRTGRRLAESIAHRGQQAQQQALHGAGLSLAVMQSEPDGRQLCASPDGRYVVVATGHLSDRSSSSRQQWQSDFLSTLSMIGVEAALSTHRGSACFAIWDAEARSLTIARDRMGERVEAAHARQQVRGGLNAHLSPAALRACTKLSEADQDLLEQAIERLQLSARAMHRILRVARTIADLAGCEVIQTAHLAEAIGYRQLDRGKP